MAAGLFYKTAKESAVRDSFGIKLLVPVNLEPATVLSKTCRLNLIIPTLEFKHSYGGITTAIRLMRRLSSEFDAIRIIVTHQRQIEIDFLDWSEWETDRGNLAPRSIVGIDDGATPVSVLPGDVFLSTAWSTAVYAREVIRRQSEFFRDANRRFVYFLQDYESGFYPWSVQSWYAESTYRNTSDTIAVFNSKRLAEFFKSRGARFSDEYVLEPLMHPDLREIRRATVTRAKERLIYVYARNDLPRNGFDLIIDSLRLWASEYPQAHEWSIVSFGDQHEDIRLGHSVVLTSMGKGSMHRYGDYLSRCWVGVSFQFMAHPSYSRLEMAEFGAWVVTNKFENNDLSDLAPNIVSVDEPTPRAVSQKLSLCCMQYRPGMSAVLENLPEVFGDRDDEFPSASELVNDWRDRSG